MRSLFSAVVVFVCLLAVPAWPSSIDGFVTGSAAPRTVWVSALRSRHLRQSDVLVVTAPTAPDGRFSLPLPDSLDSAFLVVTEQCDPRQLGCVRYFPRVEAAEAGTTGLRLEVPDAALAQTLWSGGAPPPGPARAVGAIGIAALLGLAAWLWRRGPDVVAPLRAVGLSGRELTLVASVFVGVAGLSLGSEPLDLLEYSYVHEGLRPESASALLRDPISAELAHGPVTPLILRAVASVVGEAPFWLRAPSVLFGAGFVVLTAMVVGAALGRRSAWLGAALAAVSPVALYYSRDATPYALVGLLAAAAVALVELPRTNGVLRWTAFALVHVVGFFAHYGFAFFSVGQGVALLLVGVRRQPRMLACAGLAFAAAGALPVVMAPHFEHMLASSGLRFGLMAAAYPESPGLMVYAGRIAAVVAGVSGEYPWSIALWAAAAVVGGRALWAASPRLFAQAAACVALTALWLVFSHTMSVAYGGGRIYWAFRWARPLLGGFVVLAAAGAASRIGLGLGLGCVALGLGLDIATVAPPVRPAQTEIAARVRGEVEAGDAYAVLPASFYGDPIQYYMAETRPSGWLTAMRTRDLDVGGRALRGPLVEIGLPLETMVDRLEHPRVWVVAFDEHMFGTAKFSPAPRNLMLSALRGPMRYAEELHVDASFIALWRFRCGAECAWEGARRLVVPLVDSVRAERFLERAAGQEGVPFELPVTLVVPEGATSVTVRTGRTASAGAVRLVSSAAVGAPHASPGEWRLALRPDATRARVVVESHELNAGDLVVEMERP